MSGRAFVDPVCASNSHTCYGFKWGLLSRHGAIICITHTLTCSLLTCGLSAVLTPGVLIRLGCWQCLTGALGSDNWSLYKQCACTEVKHNNTITPTLYTRMQYNNRLYICKSYNIHICWDCVREWWFHSVENFWCLLLSYVLHYVRGDMQYSAAT